MTCILTDQDLIEGNLKPGVTYLYRTRHTEEPVELLDLHHKTPYGKKSSRPLATPSWPDSNEGEREAFFSMFDLRNN